MLEYQAQSGRLEQKHSIKRKKQFYNCFQKKNLFNSLVYTNIALGKLENPNISIHCLST